jgi:hypothetical protein
MTNSGHVNRDHSHNIISYTRRQAFAGLSTEPAQTEVSASKASLIGLDLSGDLFGYRLVPVHFGRLERFACGIDGQGEAALFRIRDGENTQ